MQRALLKLGEVRVGVGPRMALGVRKSKGNRECRDMECSLEEGVYDRNFQLKH